MAAIERACRQSAGAAAVRELRSGVAPAGDDRRVPYSQPQSGCLWMHLHVGRPATMSDGCGHHTFSL